MIADVIDKMIRQKLGLYAGLRSNDEDVALHNEAYDRIFLETLTFLEENKQTTDESFPSTTSTDPKQQLADILHRLIVIPNWEQKLQTRIGYYLSNWVISGQ